MAIHKTAMGKAVDMSSLSSQHEKTRAVGNMNVNARGDIVDSHNRVIQDNTKRVTATYNNSVSDHLTPSTPIKSEVAPSATKVSELTADEPVELTEEEKELFDDEEEEEEVKK